VKLMSMDDEVLLKKTEQLKQEYCLWSTHDLVYAPEEIFSKIAQDESQALKRLMQIDTLHQAKRGVQLIENGAERGYITTGSKRLDSLLGGGVKTGRVTYFVGESGSGKTQLCFQLSINVQLAKSMGGLEGGCIFVDTAGTFRPERVQEIAESREYDLESILDRIVVSRITDVTEQLRIVEQVKNLLTSYPYKLLIMDTLSENFIVGFPEADLIKRQSILAFHVRALSALALQYNIAVVLSNPVRARIFAKHPPFTIEAGGLTVSQAAHNKILLEKHRELRSGMLIDPTESSERIYFRIAREGIMDV